ncbi:MAG: carboxypeptidase-like regulatory domain-containing protein [Bacteroidaceae bacterium]|nr:carboxypeptidase-like regulatory domain-containing protein [Bacteroidaceae bacterium]
MKNWNKRGAATYSCLTAYHIILRHALLLFLLCLCCAFPAHAQDTLRGRVIDAVTGEPVMAASVYYQGGEITQTGRDGTFAKPLRRGKLRVACVGYTAQTINIRRQTEIEVQLAPFDSELGTAVVQGRRTRYSRKENPAVELMRKVIAAKKQTDLHTHDYFRYDKYTRMTFALDEVTPHTFDLITLKPLSFLKGSEEVCEETGTVILPVTMDESTQTQVWRKRPKAEKTIVTGKRNIGVTQLLSTGDNMSQMLAECFTDVNIYDNEIMLLRHQFISPIGSGAISFYHFFLGDTTDIGGDRCVDVNFTPANSQDFGFSGHLFVVVGDSSWRVRRVEMGIPHGSGVNWVTNMMIRQQFVQLSTGEHVMEEDDMIVQLNLLDIMGKWMIRRTTAYSHYDFGEIPARTFKFEGDTRTEPQATVRDEAYWDRYRPGSIQQTEEGVKGVMSRIRGMKGYKLYMLALQAFVENFIETGSEGKPGKIDIGPILSMISTNKVDGLRLRASAQTTAHLNPHLFFKGYLAYGFKDGRWKGQLETTYSFLPKAYRPHEFPRHDLTLIYTDDVFSPSDRFLGADKDNTFKALKWADVNHMYYLRALSLHYHREWGNGLQIWAEASRERTTPTLSLFYQPLSTGDVSQDAALYKKHLNRAELQLGLTYQPGVTWMNTKQRRFPTNHDAPIISLSHTISARGFLGADYTNNLTELMLYKRFWVGSWGKIDMQLHGAVQWNRVPYPFLITPRTNLSYFSADNSFSMADNMEFMADRALQFFGQWDFSGKLFNRIPLLRKLKWRELVGVNIFWGALSDRNNPYLNPGDARLFHFPGQWGEDGCFEYQSHPISASKPYIELYAGVYNVFKVFHIQYVRRLSYLGNPETKKHSIRVGFELRF